MNAISVQGTARDGGGADEAALANIIKVLLPGTLRVRHYQFRGSVMATNKASFVAYRGPWEIECWVRERLMGRLRRQLTWRL